MDTLKSERVTRIAYVINAAFEYFISLFVTGTMLGYLLDTVGFSDSLQGVLGTVATFTCGAQLFAIFLSEKRVKRICIAGNLINQICFIILYLFPFFDLSTKERTVILLILLIGGHIINNAVSPSKIAMYMDSVQLNKRGSFTAIKEMISLAGGIALSLVMGRIADIFRSADGLPTKEYYVICAVALVVMTLIHTGSVVAATEKTAPPAEKTSLNTTVKRIVKNTKFTKVVVVDILWNVTTALSISFFASYLREELAFSFTQIALLTTISSISRIIASPLLGKIADKYSFATSMTISFGIAGAGFLAMVFTAPETKWLYIAYSCLYGIAMAGINSGVINLVYDYVGQRDRATAMGFKNAIGGILAFFTALLSGAVMDAVQKRGGFYILGARMYAQQMLSLFSLVMVILLIAYMRLVIFPLKRSEDVESAYNDADKS